MDFEKKIDKMIRKIHDAHQSEILRLLKTVFIELQSNHPVRWMRK